MAKLRNVSCITASDANSMDSTEDLPILKVESEVYKMLGWDEEIASQYSEWKNLWHWKSAFASGWGKGQR